jgi:ADP-ribose pyrophosphatase YjhB (NUDIX family)
MATTAIVAEILIAGLETLVWLSLLVIALIDIIWFKRSGYREWLHPSNVGGWGVLATTLAIAAAYVAGILVDRLADSMQTRLWKIRPGHVVDKPARIAKMRLAMMRNGGDVARFLEYQRSRFRIARATAVNSLFAVVAVPFFLWDSNVEMSASIVVAGALLLLAVASQKAFRRIEVAYLTRLSDAYRLSQEDWQPKRAAAVVWRRREGGTPEFLLVTTSDDDDRWTFPKGHYDADEDETLAETAAREAREEAGVEGKIDGNRLLVYRFPTKKKEERAVAAFLLDVRTENLGRHGADARRRVGWFEQAEARRLLSAKREPEYATEAERVLAAAAKRLEGRPPNILERLWRRLRATRRT